MKRSHSIILIAVLSAAISVLWNYFHRRQQDFHLGPELKCYIVPHDSKTAQKGLLVGYSYELLESYAQSDSSTAKIYLEKDYDAAIDSLMNFKVDIVSIPYRDSLEMDSLLVSIPIDSLYIFLLSRDDQKHLKKLNEWIEAYHSSEEFGSFREKYLVNYDPIKSRYLRTHNYLSPYDELFKSHADSIGMDWRLLVAIAYQESRFHIEAVSRRGASGLMQMMPHTANMMEAVNLLNPDESIAAASGYLSKLYRRYVKAESKEQRIKFTLAAYNAGEGRIHECVEYAATKGIEPRNWEEIASLIPEMNGNFKGRETRAYVQRVWSIYKIFCRICPE